PARIADAEAALANGTLERDFIYRETAACIQNPTSIAFGGPDLRTAFVGSLNHTELKTFRSPVAGAKPVHWDW
ncbi:MAG: SMP-30/gluconolactonase/LRE family protein, partial [Pseudomonadota bacterium]